MISTRDHYAAIREISPMRQIIEIGCEKMGDTERLRGYFPEAQIHCFEIDPRSIDYVLKNGLPKRFDVIFHPNGLSDRPGTRQLFQSTLGVEDPNYQNGWTASSSLHAPVKPNGGGGGLDWLKFEIPILVEVSTLDDTLIPVMPVDLIWMDAQASEADIIRGGQRVFKKSRYLYAEHDCSGCYHDEPGLVGILAALPGWSVIEQWQWDVLLKNNEPES